MLFDKYAKKAVKIVKFGNFFIKNQLAFIISGASIVTVSTTLCATKGTIVESKDNPTNYVYGEEISYNAKAFLDDVRYEFSTVGSDEWVDEVPKLVGSYKVRAVSQNILSNDKYGDEHVFTISPKKIDVSVLDTSYIYGEKPNIKADFSYGDNVVDFDFK